MNNGMKRKELDETIVLCCKRCGTEFLAKSRHRLYCSDLCKSRTKNAKSKLAYKRPAQDFYICRYCGKKFQSEQSGREFCGHDCLRNYMRDMHAQNRDQHDMRRIRITKEIPVFPELRPAVGAVYEAERYGSRYFSAKFYIIPDIMGKRIVVRGGECVEV